MKRRNFLSAVLVAPLARFLSKPECGRVDSQARTAYAYEHQYILVPVPAPESIAEAKFIERAVKRSGEHAGQAVIAIARKEFDA